MLLDGPPQPLGPLFHAHEGIAPHEPDARRHIPLVQGGQVTAGCALKVRQHAAEHAAGLQDPEGVGERRTAILQGEMLQHMRTVYRVTDGIGQGQGAARLGHGLALVRTGDRAAAQATQGIKQGVEASLGRLGPGHTSFEVERQKGEAAEAEACGRQPIALQGMAGIPVDNVELGQLGALKGIGWIKGEAALHFPAEGAELLGDSELNLGTAQLAAEAALGQVEQAQAFGHPQAGVASTLARGQIALAESGSRR